MLDAAFRQIAGAVSTAVGGPYAAAKLFYPGEPVYDDGGAIIVPGVPYEVDCQVQVDVASETMRLTEGFMAEDVRLLILGPGTLDRTPKVSITAGPFAGKSYSLMSVQRDPLGFGWDCRGRTV